MFFNQVLIGFLFIKYLQIQCKSNIKPVNLSSNRELVITVYKKGATRWWLYKILRVITHLGKYICIKLRNKIVLQITLRSDLGSTTKYGTLQRSTVTTWKLDKYTIGSQLICPKVELLLRSLNNLSQTNFRVVSRPC